MRFHVSLSPATAEKQHEGGGDSVYDDRQYLGTSFADAQREFKEVNISQWGKNQKKIDHLRFKSAFSNCFGSESKFY